MRVYLDYNATSPPRPEVVETVARHMRDVPGNASSIHTFGQAARAALDTARAAVADLVGGDPGDLVLLSGGTEADNLAIRGAAMALEATGRRRLVTSAIEHEAVLTTCRALARRGWSVTELRPSPDGLVSPERQLKISNASAFGEPASGENSGGIGDTLLWVGVTTGGVLLLGGVIATVLLLRRRPQPGIPGQG